MPSSRKDADARGSHGTRKRWNVVRCTQAIQACKKGGDWRQALKHLAAAVRVTVQLDVVMCTASLSIAVSGGRWQLADELLADMQHTVPLVPGSLCGCHSNPAGGMTRCTGFRLLWTGTQNRATTVAKPASWLNKHFLHNLTPETAQAGNIANY
eukprot:TRINITY_DN7165_c0_g2_i2.p2 TRINITY_DN7165_c0_g2~~TRINITY_DN7165_c0_g2_i2.p2  ORF type:complete len:154 (+),score=5.74 TRINITY_DN7165_c0_g2_i2:184-645(+)